MKGRESSFMSQAFMTHRPSSLHAQISRILELLYSFVLSAAAAIVLIANVTIESFNWVRLGAALAVLILLHLLRYRRFVFSREFAFYAAFVAYMFLSLLWAPDLILAMNTLVPAVDFVLILILFSALVTYHDFRAVLAGILSGFLLGAAVYTATSGFPFVYPPDFSYNAMATMYLFGLFIGLLQGWSMRSRVLSVLIGLVLLVLIAATTSIKTNLGILLGVVAAGLLYFKSFAMTARRYTVPIVAVIGMIIYAAASNDGIVERVQVGVERVALGVEILSSRDDDVPSGTSYKEREYWLNEGLRGWAANPLFGHGVEAFRADYGITSHSTPIDLLYNTGVIGLVLFYTMFISICQRLLYASNKELTGLRALLFAMLVCYLFITLSGTMLYSSFMAVFIAISTAILRDDSRQTSASEASLAAAYP